MFDESETPCPAYASRISIKEQWELDYWTREFDVTPERLRQAIKVVGASAVMVRASLGRPWHAFGLAKAAPGASLPALSA